MKIKFKETTELELVVNFDEKTDTGEFEMETFQKGDEEEVEIFNVNFESETSDMQFGDGSLAFGVSNKVFEVVKSENSPFDESEEFHRSCA